MQLADDVEHLDGTRRGLEPMPTPRHQQIADMRQTRPRQIDEQGEAITLGAKLEELWTRYRTLVHDEIKPALVRAISIQVRKYVPEAAVLEMEASDQGGDSWVLRGVKFADGTRLHPEDGRGDGLHDDDTLTVMLMDYGIVEPSSDGVGELVLVDA